MNIKLTIEKVLAKQNLTSTEMREVMQQVMTGTVHDVQIAAFLAGLRCKGETVTELAAAVTVIRELASKVTSATANIVDTCGTGGDGANTFNISTACALVTAASGVAVAKHGNRAVSSSCGSADVLEAAGVNLDLSPAQIASCIDTVGVGFLFAPKLHAAMKYAATARKHLGVRTLFNLIGPLANPACANKQLIGVFSRDWLLPMAQVLQSLASEAVLVVAAQDGLDEISTNATTDVAELRDGVVSTYQINPEQFGIERAGLAELAVGDVADSLAMLLAVLGGNHRAGADIVALNAGAAIYIGGGAASLAKGVAVARANIENGAALAKLHELIAYSQRC